MKQMKLFYLLALLCLPFVGITQSVITYDRANWTINPSSEELTGELPNGPAIKMLDGDNSTYWVSRYSNPFAEYPHTLVFDMQDAQPVNQVYYVPRSGATTNAYAGSVSFGDDGINFGTELPVSFSNSFEKNIINLPATQNHRYFRITVTENYADHAAGNTDVTITTIAEVGAIYNTTLDHSLTSFTAQAQGGGVQLNWSTAFEMNGVSYNITRSDDAVNFTTIGTVTATGSSSTTASYSFTDATPLTGVNFYRLELVHTSGPVEKSLIKNTDFPIVTYSSTQSKNLNVFYFIPAGKASYPDFKTRVSGVMLGLQNYYKDEMQRNGRGTKTFSLVTDATNTKVKIIVVNGKFPFEHYDRDSSGVDHIQAEIDAYIAANPSPYYSSHNLTVTPAFGYNPVTGIVDERVPVVGNGKNCYTLDYPDLNYSLLGVNSPQGEAATVNIGGTAHEAGHSLGLYHNGTQATQPQLGEALMRGGNYTFGKTTTSLTAADCAILNRNQVFNDGSISYYGPNKATISSVHACYSASKNAIIVAGRTSTTGSPVTDVSIYQDSNNDPFATGMGTNQDYDAVTWTTAIAATDSFYIEMPIAGLFVKDSSLYEMKILLIQQDGNTSDLYYHFDFHNNLPYMTDPAFSLINATITASAGTNGSISPAGTTTISCVDNQTYTITPNAGYAVQDVLVDGVSAGAVTTYTFTGVNTHHTISVTFVAVVVNYTITASAGANGSISPTGEVSVVSGANQAFTFTANPCYQIATVLVDGISDPVAVSNGTYTFSNVTAAHTIAITFSQLTYNITASAGANGSVSPNGVTSVNCGADQAYTITPDAGYNIQNVIVDGVSQSSIPTYTFTNVTATHSISASFVEISAGCAVTGTGTTTPVTCAGSNGTATIMLAGSGSGAPGTYTVDGGSSVAYTTNPFTITGLSAGLHTIVATVTAGGCVSADIVVNVGSPVTFSATHTKTNISACNAGNDGTVTVIATGGSGNYSYAWTGVTGSGNPATTPFPNPGSVSSLTNLPIGFYNVTITDVGGCGSVTIPNIHIQSAFLVYVTYSGSSASCGASNGSITLYGNAGVQPYTYNLGSGAYQPGNIFTGLAAGTYTMHVKDAAGCIVPKDVTVPATPALVVNPFVRNASSCAPDGSIEVYRTGGVPPYQYSKDGTTYQSSNVFSGLAAGPYTVYVKDGNNCISQANAAVGAGAGLSVTTLKVNASCINDGSIQVNVTGGVAPYQYSKDGGTTFQASNAFGSLGAGNYPILVKDSKGCTSGAPTNVTINVNSISVTASVVSASTCVSNNGKIQLFRTGGTGPFTYSIDGLAYQSSNTFLNVAAGTYQVFVKDSKTCIGSLEGVVVGPAGCAPVVPFAKGTSVRLQPTVEVASVQAYPNPSADEFTIALQGYDAKTKVSITVTDVLGRKVYQTEGTGKLQYKLGKGFIAGIYNVQVIQGNSRKGLKIVKE